MRNIVLFIAISICVTSIFSQTKSNRSYSDYNFYELNDTCIFRYTPTISWRADSEVYYPKAFEIKLPKQVKYFESDYSQYFRFYLTNNQTVFVDTDLYDEKLYTSDTIYIPNINELEVLTKFQYHASSYSKYFEKVQKVIKKRRKTRNSKNRVDIVLIRKKCKILLFNIEKENLESYLNLVEEFKQLPSVNNHNPLSIE